MDHSKKSKVIGVKPVIKRPYFMKQSNFQSPDSEAIQRILTLNV